ncbi:MAG TPA: BON domain-containing protein [Actinomycetota bacterium]|nr:BON domain-containing protein [Actinomycetota bacterium]
MSADTPYYATARLQERLVQETGDLDVTVTVVGTVVVITGSVASPEQREQITAIAREEMPSATVRNETTLPRVTESLPPETIEP